MNKICALRSRSREVRKRWSRNAVAARARRRVERAESELPEEEPFVDFLPRRIAPDAIISIRLPKIGESKTFRVHRVDAKRLLAFGKVQAASTIGKRVGLVLEFLTTNEH